ncbi:hypothetical protein V6N12_051154 [Hibiscus sabdariffa]|uniref:Uncharacterized protein n=1 Tax=Hibiscus sabdariffa TaxID=183260 RepID=A0ABR2GEJ8_9ROSI
MKKGKEVVNQNSCLQAESSSEHSRSSLSERTENRVPLTEDFNAIFLGKEKTDVWCYEAMFLNRHLGEWDIKGVEQIKSGASGAGVLREEGSQEAFHQNLSLDSPIIERLVGKPEKVGSSV